MTTETPRTEALFTSTGPALSQAVGLARALERELAAMTAERNRLRDALNRLVYLSCHPLFVPQNDVWRSVLLTWDDAVENARAALEEKS